MFLIKKCTRNYFFSYNIKFILYKFSLIAFFSFFKYTKSEFSYFTMLCVQYGLKFAFLLSKFVTFLFRDFYFFSFLRTFFLLVYTNTFNLFSEFYLKNNSSFDSFSLVGFCLHGFFFNLSFFSLRSSELFNFKLHYTIGKFFYYFSVLNWLIKYHCFIGFILKNIR